MCIKHLELEILLLVIKESSEYDLASERRGKGSVNCEIEAV